MPDIKDKTGSAGNTLRDQAGKFADQAKDTASGVVGAVSEKFQDAACGAREMAGKAAEQVRDTAKEWMGTAEDATKTAARKVQHVASDAADTVGDLGQDLTRIIRRNPVPAVLVSLGIGFLAATVLRRSSLN